MPVLDRLRELRIPVVLSSSKTAAELIELSVELHLDDAPLICENGGQILWNSAAGQDSDVHVSGTDRREILRILAGLKTEFQFRSFADLGLEGVMQTTDLPQDQAGLALDRHSTEPLLWDDDLSAIDRFRVQLQTHALTLTKGGRFWHVAGTASKGNAMQLVAEKLSASTGQACRTVAIGDSPIDQSMLDVAHYPIGIPSPDGSLNVNVCAESGIVAPTEGSVGWAQAVTQLLDQPLSHR